MAFGLLGFAFGLLASVFGFWLLASALYPVKTHPERISHYKNYVSAINMPGIKYPVRIEDIDMIEKQNSNFSVQNNQKVVEKTLGWKVYPLDGGGKIKLISRNKVPHSQQSHIIDLLLIEREVDGVKECHYTNIKDIQKLLADDSKTARCQYCFHKFASVRRNLKKEKTYEEYLAAKEKGIKVKPVSKPPVPKTCAEALEQHLANGCRENHDVKTRIVLPKPENDEMVYDAE